MVSETESEQYTARRETKTWMGHWVEYTYTGCSEVRQRYLQRDRPEQNVHLDDT